MNWTKNGVFIEYPCCSIQQGCGIIINHMKNRALASMVGPVLYLEKKPPERKFLSSILEIWNHSGQHENAKYVEI